MEFGFDWQWMCWTPGTAIFFLSIFVMIAGMTFWDIRSPAIARKGVLPIMTTRGERLFIILLGSAFIQLAWVGMTILNPWFGLGLASVYGIFIARWG